MLGQLWRICLVCVTYYSNFTNYWIVLINKFPFGFVSIMFFETHSQRFENFKKYIKTVHPMNREWMS